MSKSVSPKFVDADGNTNCVEILGKGQQLVAYGIHPDTQQEYYWPKDCPTTVPIYDLPTISAEQITELFFFFDRSTPAKWKCISPGSLQYQPDYCELHTLCTLLPLSCQLAHLLRIWKRCKLHTLNM